MYGYMIAPLLIILLSAAVVAPMQVMLHFNKETAIIKLSILGIKFTLFDKNRQRPAKKEKPPSALTNIVNKQIEKFRKAAESKDVTQSIGDFVSIVKAILSALKQVATSLTFREFKLKLWFGTGDAAQTGIYYGRFGFLVMSIAALINSNFKTQSKPLAQLVPVFHVAIFDYDFECSIKTSVIKLTMPLAKLVIQLIRKGK